MGSGISYSQSFRDKAVRLVVEFSRPFRDVVSEIGVNKDTLRSWVNKARRDREAGTEHVSVEESKEKRKLQRQINDLEMENSFLKKRQPSLHRSNNGRSIRVD